MSNVKAKSSKKYQMTKFKFEIYFRPGEYPAPWGEGFCPLWSLIPRCLRRGSSLVF